jgi:predicted lipoprotein with Yx(FWY)xxD motif
MKTSVKLFLVAVLWAAALPVLAAGPSAPASATVSVNGAVVGAQGRPLYVYDKDTAATSACTGPCVASWPPVMADAAAKPSGDWSLIDRPDGGRQWAYKGKPVYGFYRDTSGGSPGGDNKVPGWRLLK